MSVERNLYDSDGPDGGECVDPQALRYSRQDLPARFEVFNVMNHPSFGFPNVARTNSAFGLITTQSNQPRSVQVGARLVF